MNIVGSVGKFVGSIDFSLLWPVLGAFIVFMIVMALRRFGTALSSLFYLQKSDFIRIGDIVVMPTATGSCEGTILDWDRNFVHIDLGNALRHIPTQAFISGRITVLKRSDKS